MFIHLRTHSPYSLCEGAVRLDALAQACRTTRTPAVGLTDTNNLFGALEFSEKMAAAGVQPIMGVTLSIDLEDDDAAREVQDAKAKRAPAVALLATNEEGWRNLTRLVSAAHLETPTPGRPIATWARIAAHAPGLIMLTGGPGGPVDALLRKDKRAEARALLARFREAFGDRLYVELQRHDTQVEARVEPHLLDLAYDLDLPIVATNQAYFLDAAMHRAHDALLCIAEAAYVSDDNRRRVTPEHYLKPPEAMEALFADLPEAIANTVEIALRCAYRPAPIKPLLPHFETEGGRSEIEELRAQARAGLESRLRDNPLFAERSDYEARLDHELSIIEGMGFPGYFLIVADFIGWAKNRGIPVGPGRGSGAGSVVAWSLKITDLDPLRFNLLFERFLNPERVSMPDFDVDFCQERRDEVITYVQEKYGRDRVAQIITFGKLQARAVVRDVGRVLQMPFGQVDRLAKLIPNNPANPTTLAQAIDGEPKIRALMREGEDAESYAALVDIALKLEGLYRHASTHAAGVVIGDRPLDELVPLYRDPRSAMPATQYNMNWVEQAGLVKFDFLGLKTLTVLSKAADLIRAKGEAIDLDHLPFDDAKTFELLQSGETAGVFQLESAGMRDALKGLKADTIEDIIALVSLYRPGPMDNIPAYIDRKNGREAPDYLHDKLKRVLEETYGVIIYQEQVMQIAQILSGYSLGEADLLRRAMGKKKKAEMDRQKVRFLDGAQERGVERAKAAGIFELVAKFAGYGFNKSHAAAYAVVAYQTAYLKAHHPREFLAASMTLDMANADKLNIFRSELRRMGAGLLPPDVNRSEVEFAVREDGVDYALSAIRNVGVGAVEAIVSERRANGDYADLFDLAGRAGPKAMNKRALEMLAQAGAFDGLERNRKRAFEAAGLMSQYAQAMAEERASAQSNLFGEKAVELARPRLPETEDWPALDRLAKEAEAVGFYLSGHPLDAYADALAGREVLWIADAHKAAKEGRSVVKTAGVVRARSDKRSKTGKPYAFLSLSDPTGDYEVTVFSDTLADHGDLLQKGATVVLTLGAEPGEDDVRWIVKGVKNADFVAANSNEALKIYLKDDAGIDALKRLLDEAKGGGASVSLSVVDAGMEREIDLRLPGRYALDGRRRAALKDLPCVESVGAGEPA